MEEVVRFAPEGTRLQSTHPPVPLVLNDQSGATVFRLNRDGSVETDWARIQAMAERWHSDEGSWAVILCKALVAVAERVQAETEARHAREQ